MRENPAASAGVHSPIASPQRADDPARPDHRPLTPEQLTYGAMDAEVLLPLSAASEATAQPELPWG